MKIRLVIFFLLLFVRVTPALAAGDLSVYFVPHQDDEMYMGGSIVSDVLAGKRVYVVLATDGSASNVRKSIDKKLYWSAPETYKPLTIPLFVAARDREFIASIRDLGVPRNHILFWTSTSTLAKLRSHDGELTNEKAASLYEAIEKKLGVGMFTTIFPVTVQHPDHHALGLGLVQATIASTKRFFYEQPQADAEVDLSGIELWLKRKGLREYYVWKPEDGRLAVAAHSVDMRLEFWLHENAEYMTTTYANR